MEPNNFCRLPDSTIDLTLDDVIYFKSSNMVTKKATQLYLYNQGKGWVTDDSINLAVNGLAKDQLESLVEKLQNHLPKNHTGTQGLQHILDLRHVLLNRIIKLKSDSNTENDLASNKIGEVYKSINYDRNIEKGRLNKILKEWEKEPGFSKEDGYSRKETTDKIFEFLMDEKIYKLDLQGYQIGTLPPIFDSPEFKRLRDLNLSSTGLTEFPSEILNLTNLNQINLGNEKGKLSNIITMIPSEIENLTSLRMLNLCNINLTELPSEIGTFNNLIHLDLSCNQNLTNLPIEILQLPKTSLISLYLADYSPLPNTVIANLREGVSSPSYNGPRINFGTNRNTY